MKCKDLIAHYMCLGVLIVIGLIFLLIVFLIERETYIIAPEDEPCNTYKSYLDTSIPINLTSPLLTLWNQQYDVSQIKNRGIIKMTCPSGYFKNEYETLFNNTLISKTEKTSSFSFERIIKDCHNQPIVKIHSYIFGATNPGGALKNYTILYNITNIDDSEIYGYYVLESLLSRQFKIVTPNGKLLAEGRRSSIFSLTTSMYIYDQVNPAADPRAFLTMYVLLGNSEHDSCNKKYYAAYTFMIILFIVAAIMMIVIVSKLFTKENEEEKKLIPNEKSIEMKTPSIDN